MYVTMMSVIVFCPEVQAPLYLNITKMNFIPTARFPRLNQKQHLP